MSPGFATHYPEGMADNSPTFQRWEPTVKGVRVPKGRLTVHAVSRPFGTYCAWTPDPNVEIETLGYCHKSLRDRRLAAQSQRDCINQPRHARNELPWVGRFLGPINPERVAARLQP